MGRGGEGLCCSGIRSYSEVSSCSLGEGLSFVSVRFRKDKFRPPPLYFPVSVCVCLFLLFFLSLPPPPPPPLTPSPFQLGEKHQDQGDGRGVQMGDRFVWGHPVCP